VTEITGAAGLIVGQPFDVVKVRYQTPEYAGRYSSTFSALGKSLSNFRGIGTGLTSRIYRQGGKGDSPERDQAGAAELMILRSKDCSRASHPLW
jgi:hypothetical protein